MISSKGGEYVEVQVASPSHRSLHFGNVHTGHAVFPTACVSCRFRKMRIAKVRVTVLSSPVQTHSIGSMDTGCILFAMMFGNRSRSPMLGFLSATFVAAASQNRCTSNLGLVVIGDILSSMTWLLPSGGKIKPHQCMAEIWKSLWVGRTCFYSYSYFMLQNFAKHWSIAAHYALAQNSNLWISRHIRISEAPTVRL